MSESKTMAAKAPVIPDDAYILIVGAMKCGTTSLYDYLSKHSNICAARIKEPEYFSRSQRHRLDIDSYQSLWDFDPEKHRYVIEASTGYTKLPYELGVPQRIKAERIEPKIIYLVRDPISRIKSHASFKDLATDGKKGNRNYLINITNYFTQIEQFSEVFGLSNVLVIDMAQLKSEPRAVLDRICNFLSLDCFDVYPDFSARNVTLTKREKMIKSTLSRMKIKGLYDLIPHRYRLKLRNLVRAFSPNKRDELPEAFKLEIQQQLRPDMQKLSDKYAVDISSWEI